MGDWLHDRIHRLQSHILPAVRVGLPRYAAPLLAVQSEYQVLKSFDRWGHHPGRDTFYPDLLHVVDALWSRQLIIRGALPVLNG
jgi:hypothetical protein